MILLNTSFHMHVSVERDFLDWVRHRYAAALERHGGMGYPTLARMLVKPDEDTVSYCFQMTAESEQAAAMWHDSDDATALRGELTRRFGELIVHFTTYMEILPRA